eukprot:PhM_4_TR6821/c0_g1_i2/m.63362
MSYLFASLVLVMWLYTAASATLITNVTNEVPYPAPACPPKYGYATTASRAMAYHPARKRVYFATMEASMHDQLRYYDVTAGSIVVGIGNSDCSTTTDKDLDQPQGLLVQAGRIYLADTGKHVIRLVLATTHDQSLFLGVEGSPEDSNNVPGKLNTPTAMVFLNSRIFLCQTLATGGNIKRIVVDTSPTTPVAVSMSNLADYNNVNGITALGGNIYAIASGENLVLEIDATSGTVSEFSLPTNGHGPTSIIADCARHKLYIAASTGQSLISYDVGADTFSLLYGGGVDYVSTDIKTEYPAAFTSTASALAISDDALWSLDGSGVLTKYTFSTSMSGNCVDRLVQTMCMPATSPTCANDGECTTAVTSLVGTTSEGHSSVFVPNSERIYFFDQSSGLGGNRLRYYDILTGKVTTIIGSSTCTVSENIGSGHLVYYQPTNVLFVSDSEKHVIREIAVAAHAPSVWIGTLNSPGETDAQLRTATLLTKPTCMVVVTHTLFWKQGEPSNNKLKRVDIRGDSLVTTFLDLSTTVMPDILSMTHMHGKIYAIQDTTVDAIFEISTVSGTIIMYNMPSSTSPALLIADCARRVLYIASLSNRVLTYKFSTWTTSLLVGGGTTTTSTNKPTSYQLDFSIGRSLALDTQYLWIGDTQGLLTRYNLGESMQQECDSPTETQTITLSTPSPGDGAHVICGTGYLGMTCNEDSYKHCSVARIGQVYSITRNPTNNDYYFTETNQNLIRRINPNDGYVLNDFAGGPISGSSCESSGGFASDSSLTQLNQPYAVLYLDGSLYITDTLNDRLRKKDLNTQDVSIVFGNGDSSTPTEGSTSGPLPKPKPMVAYDDSMYVGLFDSARIVRIVLGSTYILTLSHNLQNPTSLAIMHGTLYALSAQYNMKNCIHKFGLYTTQSTGTISTCDTPMDTTTGFNGPNALVADCGRNAIIVADSGSNTIKRFLTETETIEIVMGGPDALPVRYSEDGTRLQLTNPVGVFLEEHRLLVTEDAGRRILDLDTPADAPPYKACVAPTATRTVSVTLTGTLSSIESRSESESQYETSTESESESESESPTLSLPP